MAQHNQRRKQDLVVLFGDSLFIEAMETCLGEMGEIGVIHFHNSVADARQRLQSLRPDLIILDLDAADCHLVVPFLREQPGVSVLCVDRKCSEALAICGQHYSTSSAEELCELIRVQIRNGVVSRLPAAAEWYSTRLDPEKRLLDLIQKEENKQ